MIPCVENCIYQKDGYCTLKGKSVITNLENNCPYFDKKDENSSYKFNSFFNSANINEFN